MADWFSMGGYAGFVWASYGLSFVALAGLCIISWRGYVRAKAKLEAIKAKGSP